MALVKRGTCSSEPSDVIVSESVCCCPACGHTDVLRAKDMKEGEQKCSKCDETMEIISNSSRPEAEDLECQDCNEDTEETNKEDT